MLKKIAVLAAVAVGAGVLGTAVPASAATNENGWDLTVTAKGTGLAWDRDSLGYKVAVTAPESTDIATWWASGTVYDPRGEETDWLFLDDTDTTESSIIYGLPNGTYTVEFEIDWYDAAWNTHVEMVTETFSVSHLAKPVKKSTTLSLKLDKHWDAKHGAIISTLKRSGKAYKGQRVYVQVYYLGVWQDAKSYKTNAKGTVGLTVKKHVKGAHYKTRLVFKGNATTKAAKTKTFWLDFAG